MKRCLFAVMMILMLYISAARAGALEEGLAAALMGDYGRAFSLFQPLAREGDARAQFNLGVLYERGQSAVPDFSKATLWYGLSAEKGHAGAQTNLGALYENGQGATKDDAQAVQWYRQAAAQGNGTAQFNLGLMFAKGMGIERDEVRAYMWFALAAMSGESNALQNRNVAAKRMTPQQIGQARELAARCLQRHFLYCD